MGSLQGIATAAINLHPGFRSGIYYFLHPNTITTSSIASVGVNSMNYIPLQIPKPVTIDRIGVFVGTGVAGSLLRLGIYSNVAGLPGNLISGSDGGDILCATSGFKEAVINSFLPADCYWVAVNANISSPSLHADSVRIGFKYFLGEVAPSVATAPNMLKQTPVTYGAMPNSAPISSLVYQNGQTVFWVRAQ
jgi:hypothetical protein